MRASNIKRYHALKRLQTKAEKVHKAVLNKRGRALIYTQSGASAPPGFRWEIITRQRKSEIEPAAYRGGGHLALRYTLHLRK